MDDDYTELLEKAVNIDPMDLNTEYVEFPAQLSYWNAVYADAYHKASIAKADYDRSKAAAFLAAREQTGPHGKATTEKEALAMVELDSDVQESQIIYVEAEAAKLRARGVVDTLLSKRDMLQSLGAKLRVEMAGNPAIRDMHAAGSVVDFGSNR